MYYVGVARFVRDQGDPAELGFYVNEDILLDKQGEQVDDYYDVEYLPHYGCFTLPKQPLLEIPIDLGLKRKGE